ncbi:MULTISPECIES: erythromycin esterase family protein [Corallococcus]|uniref:erythromycin esterase family protein n=1 Tax=Corallococcus TaxID=83461 RepID=UPI00117DE39D|nr:MULTISPECIES: erythromycin esterase family protein [Corallococcus]NBD10426.1 hypothetical protein [Corallococcus silvisoli]TSC27637.1 erythromycin esterase family protein [Corallococcus sp. Z5C101001]
MNKKWVIGLGLGCGGVLVLGVVGLVAAGYWANANMGGSGVDAVMDAQARTQRFAELNTLHPFTPPATGGVLKLEEARLETYLTAREATLPAFHIMEKESVAFVEQHGAELDRRDTRSLLKAAGASMRMVGKVQAALIQNLEAHAMSPLEFQTLTTVVYPPPPSAQPLDAGVAAVSRPTDPENIAALEQQLAALTPQLEDPKLTEAQRLQLEQRRAGLRKSLTQLEQASGKDVKDANAALLKKHEARIAQAANPLFDQLLVNPKPPGTARRPSP